MKKNLKNTGGWIGVGLDSGVGIARRMGFCLYGHGRRIRGRPSWDALAAPERAGMRGAGIDNR